MTHAELLTMQREALIQRVEMLERMSAELPPVLARMAWHPEQTPPGGWPAKLAVVTPLERFLVRLFEAWMMYDAGTPEGEAFHKLLDVELLAELERRELWPRPDLGGF